jgi:hypothetical protein
MRWPKHSHPPSSRIGVLHWYQVGRRYNLVEWWHLLSLDAPTVAALWSWFFARAMHLRIPFLAALLLAAATWMLYVTDRILDGLGRSRAEMRERHIFYARHRGTFVAAALILAGPLLWMVLTRMYPRTLREDLFLSVFAALYLFVVHVTGNFARAGRHGWLPKELAVGILFAAATAVPAWSHLDGYPGAAKERLAQAVMLFAVLCWINCVAIEKWEAGGPSPSRASTLSGLHGIHASTRWAGAHLRPILSIVALFSAARACLAPTYTLSAIYLAALLSSSLILALDAWRSWFSPLSLRIAADAALLTPIAFLPILRK